MDELKYIFIAGTSKAGTTSLFDYLVAHPSIQGSLIKQTNFFLKESIQEKTNLKSIHSYNGDFRNFYRFFLEPTAETKYRIEATPDCIHSPGSAEMLSDFSSAGHDVKVIIILRNPVTRFVSFYNFGKQQGLIPEKTSFKEFYNLSKEYNDNENPALMAYKTGFYSHYIAEYKRIFGNNLKVVFFEMLAESPREVVSDVAEFCGFSSKWYEDFEFRVSNPTRTVKSRKLAKLYGFLRERYLSTLFKSKVGAKFGIVLKQTLSPLYQKLNYSTTSFELDKEVLDALCFNYSDDFKELEFILNRRLPWSYKNE